MASNKFLRHIVFFFSEIPRRQQRSSLLLLVWLRVSYRRLRGANCVLISSIHYILYCIHYIQIFILVTKLYW